MLCPWNFSYLGNQKDRYNFCGAQGLLTLVVLSAESAMWTKWEHPRQSIIILIACHLRFEIRNSWKKHQKYYVYTEWLPSKNMEQEVWFYTFKVSRFDPNLKILNLGGLRTHSFASHVLFQVSFEAAMEGSQTFYSKTIDYPSELRKQMASITLCGVESRWSGKMFISKSVIIGRGYEWLSAVFFPRFSLDHS